MLKTLHAWLLAGALGMTATSQAMAEDFTDGATNLYITLFLHDQLSEQEIRDLNEDYLPWFVNELEEVTGRRVSIQPVRHAPGYTDFPYRNDDIGAAIETWSQRVAEYIDSNNLPSSHRHKYVLLTHHKINASTHGVAYETQNGAIASLRSTVTLAHEVGHLFGATHENAESRFEAPWFCNTIMYPTDEVLKGHCRAYSERNRQAIRDYLDQAP